MKRMAAVIPAGGYGTLDGSSCKLLVKVAGKPILLRVIEAVKATGMFSPIVVVVNQKFGPDIRSSVEEDGHCDVICVDQPERRGAADAAVQAVPYLESQGADSFLVVLGEMLFMSPETMTSLVNQHVEQDAHMSYLTCPFDPTHPLAPHMDTYAFVEGPKVLIYSGKPPSPGSDVIGSAYVFDLSWFKWAFSQIKPMDKGDGYGVEYHLPAFIEVAAKDSYRFVNFRKQVPHEIFGINTPAHFEVAQQISELTV